MNRKENQHESTREGAQARKEEAMTWTERKVAGMCARAGCHREPQEDHDLCEPCMLDHRQRQNRSAVERRAYRRRQAVLPLSMGFSTFR